MRNLKKFVALIVTLAMMATFAIPAFAATPADVAGTEYEGAVNRLLALGITTGYPDGSFGPNDTVTRAQAAAFVVRALGYESVAESAKGVTKFSDVAANYWASGYINLAVSLGVIKGYGDGKFGPEDKVTFEQMVTMVVRALGQDGFAENKGGFPTGYLLQAKVIGFTNNVKGVAGVSATRGIVAQLFDNAKTADIYELTTSGGDTKIYEKTGKTFLSKLGMSVLADGKIVTQTPASAGLGANKFVAGGVTYTAVAGTVDVESLLGKKVDLWGSAPDKVVLAENVVGTAVAVKTVNSYSVANAVYNVTLADGTKKDYKVTAATGAIFNLEAPSDAVATLADLIGEPADQVQVSLIVDGDGNIQYVDAIEFTNDEVAAAAVENKVAKSIKLGSYFIKQNDKDIKKLVIVKDGATVDYTAIAKGDILFVAENFGTDNANCNDDRIYIKASSAKVEGTLEAVKPSLANATSLKVDGTWYYVSTFLTDINATGNVGKEVTITLDPAGKVYSLAGPAVASNDSYVVILDNAYVPATFTTDAVYKIKVLTAAGDTKFYNVIPDTTTPANTSAIIGAPDNSAVLKGSIAKLTLNADSAVIKVVLGASKTPVQSTLDTSRLRFNNLDINASVALFYEKSNGTFAKLALADIKDDQTAVAATFVDGDIKAMLFDYNAAAVAPVPVAGYVPASTAGVYAYVTDYTALASTFLLDVITKDGAKTLETSTAVYAAKGSLISYDVNSSGKIYNISALANNANANDVTVTAADAGKIKVVDYGPTSATADDVTTTFWFTDNSLVIYDADARDGGSAQLLTKADVYADMIVDVIAKTDGSGDIIAVIISKM